MHYDKWAVGKRSPKESKGRQGVSDQGKKEGGRRKKNNKVKRKDQAKFVGSRAGDRGQRVTIQAPSSIGPHPLPPKPPHNDNGPGKRGEIPREIIHRIQVGWNNWRKMSVVFCDQRINVIKVKGRTYKTLVTPA